MNGRAADMDRPHASTRRINVDLMMSSPRTQTAAGAASAEITPPLEVGLLMSSVDGLWAPFEGIQSPLMARALVLQPAGPASGDSVASERVAVVALDLLGLSGEAVGGWARFKARVAAAARDVVRPERIVLACSH